MVLVQPLPTPQQRTLAIEQAKTCVLNHCMCARFEEDEGHYLVLFPPGYWPDGVRVSKGMGKTKALETLLNRMEQAWKDAQL